MPSLKNKEWWVFMPNLTNFIYFWLIRLLIHGKQIQVVLKEIRKTATICPVNSDSQQFQFVCMGQTKCFLCNAQAIMHDRGSDSLQILCDCDRVLNIHPIISFAYWKWIKLCSLTDKRVDCSNNNIIKWGKEERKCIAEYVLLKDASLCHWWSALFSNLRHRY